jgi:hypothetical protein
VPDTAPQAEPYNAATYPGVSPETMFNWNTPEGVALQAKCGRAFDALTRVREAAKVEYGSTDGIDTAVEGVLARGLDLLANLPPFPLPGTLASLSLEDLPKALAVAIAHKTWCRTELDLTPYGLTGVTVVPATCMIRVS